MRSIRAALLPGVSVLFALATFAAPPRKAPAARSSVLPAKEIRLENGLRVYVLERHASPTFAGYFQFGVGGTMDPKGRSGIAHLLEHMMFKGTTTVGTTNATDESPLLDAIAARWDELHRLLDMENDPFRPSDPKRIAGLKKEIEDLSAQAKTFVVKNEYDELMTRAGGVGMNASTSNDVTNYFIQLPSNRLELWFMLESDRVLHPVFREFYSERDVVHEERRLGENSADGRLWESLAGIMYDAHPYGTPVVGWPKDLLRLTSRDAMDYFRTYYSPSNCIMVIVGDVKAAEVETLARKYFGAWQRQDIPRLQVTDELPQHGERRAVVEFDSEPQMMMAWHTVPEGHADQAALDVLASILGGMQSSRLEKDLVQRRRVAASAFSWHDASRYAGMFMAGATPADGVTCAALEGDILADIAKIAESGVTADELERAKVQPEVSRVRGLKSNMGLARRIAYSVATTGDLTWTAEYERRRNAVTSNQVRDAARRYLPPSGRNVVEVRKVEGMEQEKHSGGGVQHKHGMNPVRGRRHSAGFDKAMELMNSGAPVSIRLPQIGKDLQRVKLKNGVTVFIKEDHSAPAVDMSFRWLGGSNAEPVDALPVYELAGDLWSEGGAGALSPDDFQAEKDRLGMNLWLGMGDTLCTGGFWSLTRNFDASFRLALQAIMSPRFDSARLEVLKGQYAENMQRRADYPEWGVAILQNQVINGDHPRLGFQATRTQIQSVSPDQVRAAWERHIGRDNLYITVVGDFAAPDMLARLEKAFAGWRGAGNPRREFITREPVIRPGLFIVEKDAQAPAISVTHQIKVDRTAAPADHAALEILNDILGGSGFRSRLMERLRSDEGLTYGIYSSLDHEGRPGQPGEFSVGYSTRQDAVAKSLNSVMEEMRRIVAEDVSDAEVQEQIEAWRNRFIFKFTNDFSVVNRMMSFELDDRPMDRDQVLLDAVQKVSVADVRSAADRWLKPESVSVFVFGKLTPEDMKSLGMTWPVTVVPKEDVFTGGWDASEEVAAKPAA